MLAQEEIEMLRRKKNTLITLIQLPEFRAIFKLLISQSSLPDKDQSLFEIDAGHYDNVSYLLDQILSEHTKLTSLPTTNISTSEEIWPETLQLLSNVFKEQSFKMWLKDTQLIEETEQTLHISVKTACTKNWLENYYVSPIKRAVREITGRDYEITFVPASSSEICSTHLYSNEK